MTWVMSVLEEGVYIIWHAFNDMEGGGIYVRKIPSMKVTDLARVVAPDAKLEFIGIRPGEKLHEQMISPEDAHYTYAYPDYYKILPTIHDWANCPTRIKAGVKVPQGFNYARARNDQWMTTTSLKPRLSK